ncbi:MAG: hypothetical protein LBU61_05475 [Coriobacteriales bacterium]|nr:hypothetical protein [Coriobacteriales bacterium]
MFENNLTGLTDDEPVTASTQPAAPVAASTQPAKPTAASTKQTSPQHRTGDLANKQIIFDSNEDRFSVAEQAMSDPEVLGMLIDNLAGGERRLRQFSAGAVAVVSEKQPELLAPYIRQIADALHRPEAQTRYESLEALARIVAFDPESADDAIVGAEASLYDEENGPARLGAVRFLSAYGALDAKRSQKVWPYIDEAIQCYHGDPEFQDMLIAVIGFASGRPAKQVREALAARMRFDAENAKGPLQRRAIQIIELCKV